MAAEAADTLKGGTEFKSAISAIRQRQCLAAERGDLFTIVRIRFIHYAAIGSYKKVLRPPMPQL